MGRKSREAKNKTKAMGATVDRPAPAPPARTDPKPFFAFSIFFCGVLVLTGVLTVARGFASGETNAILFGGLFTVGGVGGAIGLAAALRGSWRWSRLVYVLALAVPAGTVWCIFLHFARVRYLKPAGATDVGKQT